MAEENNTNFPTAYKSTMASTTTDNNDNKSNDDSLHNAIERLGINVTSAQHGGVPISVSVDAPKLQLLLQELQRTRDWDNIPDWKAVDLAKKVRDAKDDEDNEFAEWS